MKGLIHLYCGDGKGKTTAATGLIIRMISNKKKVLLISFLKDGTSSELLFLQEKTNVKIINPLMMKRFYRMMNDEEKEQCRLEHQRIYDYLIDEMNNYDLVVLDEVIDVVNLEILKESELLAIINKKADSVELVLSGRNPKQSIIDKVDYYTLFKAIKHPYLQGVKARKGIEF